MIIDAYHRDENYSINKDRVGSARMYIKYMWDRCQVLGLSPDHVPNPRRVDGDKLLALRSKHAYLIEVIMSYVSKIELIVPVDNAVIDVCTKESIIIHRVGNAPMLEELGYVMGCLISENEFGNNALTIAMEQDSPTIVFGEEHFLEVFKDWACFCVPIHGIGGGIVSALNVVVPVEYANQSILGLIMVAVRGIENELMLLDEKTKLMTTNEALVEFNDGVIRTASIISHEIRNSLSTVSAYVQLLQLQGILDNIKGDKILSEIGRINKLLNNFRSLSEPMRFKFYRHSLNNLLTSIVSSLSAKANISNIDIDLTLADRDIFVMMDVESMERVFINIIVNAIQAMEREGGTLTISCEIEDSGNKVHIIFKDMGTGIAEDRLDDIFKFFYTTKREGTGLGLAMCQYIVRSHGGKILVESVQNVGTKFIVILPCIKIDTTE